MSLFGALGWSALYFAAAPMAMGITETFSPGADKDIVNHAACRVLAASLAIFAIARVHAPEASLRSTLGLRGITPLQALLSVVAGAGIYPVLSTVNDLILARWPYAEEEKEALAALYRAPTPGAHVVFVVVAIVVIPLSLEVLFRGALLGELERTVPPPIAALASALLFALAQADPRGLPTDLALGLTMARLRERSGSLLAPVVGILAFGAIEGIPILRGRDPAADITYPPRWIAGGAVAALVALIAIGLGGKSEGESGSRQ
jgi:membrane protease YdiL (CAAX protease family)